VSTNSDVGYRLTNIPTLCEDPRIFTISHHDWSSHLRLCSLWAISLLSLVINCKPVAKIWRTLCVLKYYVCLWKLFTNVCIWGQ